MHANVEDICTWLMATYGSGNPVAVLVWTENDIQDCAGCMDVTDEEVRTLLTHIDEDSFHHRYGIGRDAVRDMLTNLRSERDDEI
jgi:hypothetical protein